MAWTQQEINECINLCKQKAAADAEFRGKLLSDPAAAQVTQLPSAECGNFRVVDENLSVRRLDQPVDGTDQRAFAAAGKSHHHKKFAAADGEIDVVNTDTALGCFIYLFPGLARFEQFGGFPVMPPEDFGQPFYSDQIFRFIQLIHHKSSLTTALTYRFHIKLFVTAGAKYVPIPKSAEKAESGKSFCNSIIQNAIF